MYKPNGKPCESCPFRKDVPPFLTRARAMQIAFGTRNPLGQFYCHKTVRYGKRKRLEGASTCIGFALMRAQEAGNRFITDEDGIYKGIGDMIVAHVEAGQ